MSSPRIERPVWVARSADRARDGKLGGAQSREGCSRVMEIPGYTIVRKIGEGGMATVYLAIQESLGRQVALKVMKSARVNDESFADRFLKEGRIIAQFQHPQIITVYDFGSHGPHYYFSMELLPEGTLAQQIEQGLSLERALEIVKSIAVALAYAHKRGVIHRDIKPQNILFRQDGTPVLSDFGIAKLVDADDTQLTAPGLAIGSPVYMSPEQITGKKLDHRSDLYSLGIVFYEMLARQPPYRADDVIGIAMMHCVQPVPELPAGFGQLQPMLRKLLAKDPADRFQNAEELIRALEHPRIRQPFYSFRDTTRIARSFKSYSQPKKIVLAGGLFLSIMAVGSTIYSTLFWRLTRTDSEIGAVDLPPVPESRAALTANYEQLAVRHFQKEEFGPSLELIKLGLNASPNDGRLLALREKVERHQDASRLLEQAQRDYRDGMFERSLQRVEEGLRRVPDHGGLALLRDTLRTRAEDRQRQAEQFLSQAHARWQAGDSEGSLKLIEQGLQQVAGHPELVTLREVIQGQSKQRQHVAQLLAQARDLLGRGELDESLKRIEEGLSSASEQSDFLALRDQVKTAIATNNRIGELLRDCATRFPLDRLTDQQGSEVAACYNQILALSPDHGQARARLEQVADRYADLANGALDKADFRLADAYLAQLARIRPDHARLASLNRTLRSKREQAAIEARRMLESEAKRRAADEAKRQAAEEAKRRASATLPTTPPANPPARPKSPEGTVFKPEIMASPKPAKPRAELAGQPRQKGPKPGCREALLKAQLGEPLSATEQEECRP